MIGPDVFTIDPWAIIEPELHLDLLGETESIFALSNGHFGLRGNLDEGEPHDTPGSYLNGFFESFPLPYAERGYGDPKEGQSLIDVTNGKLLRLLVDDEPFDVRYGTLLRHERRLDLRAGVLERNVEWVSVTGQAVSIRTTRLVSFVQRAVAAICMEVTPKDASARIVVQSSLVANEPIPETQDDPRAANALRAPLVSEYHRHHGLKVSLGHYTRNSGLRMAAALDHLFDCPVEVACESDSEPDLGRVTFSTELAPGQTLRVIKLLGYGWSSVRSMPALRDQVDGALSAAKQTGWEGMLGEQRAFLDDIWNNADVEIDGDPELQQAIRYAIFQVVQAAARAEQRAIPAKGLTGRGYDGHTFWDTEAYTLPVLTYALPNAARDALLFRHATLDIARERAKELHLAGASFPWRTVRGEECSGYWPAGTAGFHINAAIADGVRRYVAATGDTEFERGAGLELLVETARLWYSIGHHDTEGNYRIDGVTGPDEYTAVVDNNVYTNLMAARNLRAAAAAISRYPDRADQLGVEQEEVERWKKAADAMVVPFDQELGVTQQSEGFTRYRHWNFEQTRPDDYPLLMHYPYYVLYSSQVIKQADLVFALYRCGECFSPEQKRRDFDYYEPITVRDSSLSASIQAIVAAEVGHLDLAYAYFRETALVDLRNLAGNTKDGLHLASLSGALQVAVAGFGGLRDHANQLNFAPRLPEPLTMIRFRILARDRRIRLEIGRDRACYELLSGDPIKIFHHGEQLTLTRETPQARACPPLPTVEAVEPPPSREPGEVGIGQNGNS